MQRSAGGAAAERDAPDSVAFVRFRVGGFPLALEAGHVARVAPVPERTRLPGAPDPVVGLGYVAGAPTALVSLAGRLDVDAAADDRRVVVVPGRGVAAGLLADGTATVESAPVDAVVPPDDSGEIFLGDAAEDPLFRAVVRFDDGQAYALAPDVVAALATDGSGKVGGGSRTGGPAADGGGRP
jgi:chemotaxis signal transduction protein